MSAEHVIISVMKTRRRRHQFFLPEKLSDRLETLAAKPGGSKTAILTEAFTTWLDRDAAHELDDRFGLRLDRLNRASDRADRKLDYLMESLALYVRLYLLQTAHQPEFDEDTRRLGQLRYETFVAQIGRMMAQSRKDEPAPVPFKAEELSE